MAKRNINSGAATLPDEAYMDHYSGGGVPLYVYNRGISDLSRTLQFVSLTPSSDTQVAKSYESLQSLVEDAAKDEISKSKLLKELDVYKKASDQVASVAFAQERDKAALEIAKLRQDMELERSQRQTEQWVWVLHRVLDRNLIATLIGGGLLMVITVVLAVSMWYGKVDSNILQNAFLVVLGYFFGQWTGKSSPSEPPPTPNSQPPTAGAVDQASK